MAKQISPISDRRRIHVTPRLSSIQISARDTCPYFRPRATGSRVWSHTRENLSNLFDKFIRCINFLFSTFRYLNRQSPPKTKFSSRQFPFSYVFKFIFPLSFDNFFLSNLLHDVIIVNNIFATVSRSFFEKSFLKKKIIVTRRSFFQKTRFLATRSRGEVLLAKWASTDDPSFPGHE